MKTSNLTTAATRVGNQEGRIHQGLKSGELTKHEANRLQKGESKIRKQMAKDLFDDGKIGAKESAKLDRMQDRLSGKIHGNKHDRQTDNSPVADKRAGKLQQRVDNGISSGQLNSKESTRLDGRIDRLKDKIELAKSDGKVTNQERRQLQKMENRISVGVAIQKHDGNTAP